MKSFFEFNKKRFCISIPVALITLFVCYAVGGSLIKCIALSVAFVGMSFVKVSVKDQLTIPATVFEISLSAFVSLFLSQFMLGEGLSSVAPLSILLGYCCCLVVIGVLFLIISNAKVASVCGIGLMLLLSTANYFVYAFRGTELHFIDLFSVATAANVVSQYDYSITANLVYGWLYTFCIYSRLALYM